MSRSTPRDVAARLDEISREYDPSVSEGSFDFFLKRLQAEALLPWLLGRSMLEFGCATGELTAQLAPLAREYHVVEGSRRNIEIASARVPKARFIHRVWESFEADTSYSDILLINALEHAAEPLQLLRRARAWLDPGGRIHVIVPNGLSLHRLVGAEMGILDEPVALSEADRQIGHYRNYTVDTLFHELERAGLEIQYWRGIYLKILSNAQMLGWSWDLIRALDRVAQRFPVNCAMLYVVARPK
jgi:trans-aconitate methyltransferase